MKEKPLFYILFPLLIGIIIAKSVPYTSLSLIFLLYFFLIISLFIKRERLRKGVILFSFFIFSYIYAIAYPFINPLSTKILPKHCKVKGWVISPPEKWGNYLNFYFIVEKFKVKEWENINKKVKVKIYFPLAYKVEVGEKYIMKGYLYKSEGKSLFLVRKRKNFIYKGRKKGIKVFFIKKALYLKGKFKTNLEEEIPPPYSKILEGLLLGGREVPYKIKEIFLKRGIMHLLAVSGIHIGIIVFLFYSFLRLFPFDPRIPPLLSSILTFFYLYVIGFPSSGVRAGVIAGVYLLGKVIGRETNFLNILSLSCLLLLFINPYNLFLPGFQLTFLITFFIFYLYPLIEPKIRIHPLFLKQLIIVTFLAQISAVPLVIHYFHYVSISGFLFNFLFFPILPFLLGGGLIVPFSHFLSSGFTKFFSFPLTLLLRAVLYLMESIKISGFIYPLNLSLIPIILIYVFYLLLPKIGIRAVLIFSLFLCSPLKPKTHEFSIYPIGKGKISLFTYKGRNFLYLNIKKWKKRYERKFLEDLSDKRLDYIIISRANWENIIPAIVIYKDWKTKKIVSPSGDLIPYLDNIKVEENADFPFLRTDKKGKENRIILISKFFEK